MCLEPVARCDDRTTECEVIDDYDLIFVGQVLEDVVSREHWLLLGWTEVGEDQAVVLNHREPRLAVARLVPTALRFTRLVEALALNVE